MSIVRPLTVAIASALLVTAAVLGQATAKRGGHTIKGVVLFTGKAPAPAAVDRSSDAFCAKSPATSDEVAVKGGKLAGVHVRIQSGTAGKHAAPKKAVVIRQEGCQYVPRVVGAMAGQPLEIHNGDATMHNVHAYVGKETWFNRSQPQGAPAIRQTDLGQPGDVFTLKCDVHAWMRAFVPLTDHPYFDVTGEDGAFSLEGVPAGTYTLEAWHPKYGLKEQRVTVGGKTAAVSFQFP